MNSLQTISHHLFVAAAGQNGTARPRPRRQPRLVRAATAESYASLEVLTDLDWAPAHVTRPLRVPVFAAAD